MSAYKRKSWIEKRDLTKGPEVKKADVDFADIHKGETMLIASPKIVDAYIRKIPYGHTKSLKEMRADLANAFNADKTCPVTSGIFLRIVAEAAYEEWGEGKKLAEITPFWRIVPIGSSTAKKLSFGTAFLEDQQKKEGIFHNIKKIKHANSEK